MPTDRDLYERRETDARAGDDLESRMNDRLGRKVRDICSRLVGMGRCSEACPDGCPTFNELGPRLVRASSDKALEQPRFKPEGDIILPRIRDDDFRRLWNAARGLRQEPIQNRFFRLGRVTEYGRTFLEYARREPVLGVLPDDEVQSCRLLESWFNNLWDDACDNARMIVRVPSGTDERVYQHPPGTGDATVRRYGFRADRIHRRRTTEGREREIDKAFPDDVRPLGPKDGVQSDWGNDVYRSQVRLVASICDSLFTAMEKLEESMEKYRRFDSKEPLSEQELELLKSELEARSISFRMEGGTLMVSGDDMDRSVGLDTVNNPRTLFDDFVTAWGRTRRSPAGNDEQEIWNNQRYADE